MNCGVPISTLLGGSSNENGEQFYLGCAVCGNYLVLSKSYPVQQNMAVIEDSMRKSRHAQVLKDGPIQKQLLARRSLEAAKQAKEKQPENDSAFGSGLDEDHEEMSSYENVLKP
jgi:hypothetical protein